MITKISENEFGLDITMQPESVEEYLMLLRYAKNAKSEKPSVHLSFANHPYCYINLRKTKPTVQSNYISSKK